MKWKALADATGWFVALAALIIGVVHVREIRSTALELGGVQTSLSRDLHKVQSSLSTQFAGPFPDFLDDVLNTIRSAQHTLVILCDFPAYGDFSDPKRSLLIRQEIEQKLQSGVHVQFICLNSNRRLAALHLQFTKAEVERSLATPAGRSRMSRYLGVPVGQPVNLSYDAFIDGVEHNDEVALAQSYRNAETWQVDTDIPMFFWIADGRQGVMAVQTLGGQDEYGFRTSDQSLVNALLATRGRYVSSVPATAVK